jgi:hypothetical protein
MRPRQFTYPAVQTPAQGRAGSINIAGRPELQCGTPRAPHVGDLEFLALRTILVSRGCASSSPCSIRSGLASRVACECWASRRERVGRRRAPARDRGGGLRPRHVRASLSHSVATGMRPCAAGLRGYPRNAWACGRVPSLFASELSTMTRIRSRRTPEERDKTSPSLPAVEDLLHLSRRALPVLPRLVDERTREQLADVELPDGERAKSAPRER